MARQIQVHFFIFASMDFPLFLPKNVSLEPPSASIPLELLGCIKISTMAAKAETAIKIIIVKLSPKYKLYKLSPCSIGASKEVKFNIPSFLFIVFSKILIDYSILKKRTQAFFRAIL